MFHRLMGRVDVVTDGRTDTAHLVGGDGGADAGAADHESAIGMSLGDRRRQRPADIGEVDGPLVERTDVVHLVPEMGDVLDDGCLEREARVVRADHDAHVEPTRFWSRHAAS